MFKLFRILLTSAVVAILTIPLAVTAASDISSATYSGVVRVSNNSTATSSVATTMTLSSAELISQNYVDAAFTKMALRYSSGADVPFMPSINSTVPWSIWVPSIGANTYLNDIIYFGSSDMSSIKYWFPGSTGGSVTDSASLEHSSNFTDTFSGYIDTTAGSGKYLVQKANAYEVFVSPDVSGNVTARILTTVTETLTPDAAGDTDNGFWVLTGASDWAAVATNDADTTYLAAGAVTANITLSLSNITSGRNVVSANVSTIMVVRNTGFNTYFQPKIRLSGNETLGTQQQAVGGAYTTYVDALNRPGGGTWTTADLNSLQVGIEGANQINGRVTHLYVNVTYIYETPVSATGISSGEHTVMVSENSTHLWISIDGVSSANTTSVAAVPNNSNNYTFVQNNVMPYI